MNAKEAKRISLQNSIKTETVLEDIERVAKNGGRHYMISLLPDNVILNLMEKGYKVSTITDPFGIDSTKIEW